MEIFVIVTIEKTGAGKCLWCRVQGDDGVQVQFKDGLAGYLCRKHFWEALKSRTLESPSRDESVAAIKGTSGS